MEIRPFEERDRPDLIRLMDDFGDELAEMDPRRRLIRADGMGLHAVDRMLDGAARNGGLVVVAEEDDRLRGFAGGEVHRRDPDERFEVLDFVNGKVTELFVAPEARRRGVGRALLAALDEHFRSAGCEAVRLEVFATDVGARRFYEALGYEERELWLFRPLTP